MINIPLNRSQRVAGALLLGGIGGILWYLPRAGNAREEKHPPAVSAEASETIPVTTAVAAERDFPRWHEATGTVRPQFESLLAAKVMGRVEEVTVREGDRIRRGQTLVRLDARDSDASIAQADAGLRTARVRLVNAKVAARMETSLSAARIAQAKAELTRSEAALQAAIARRQLAKAGPRPQERAQAAQAVAAAKADLDLAETTLKRMTDLFDQEAIARQSLDQTKAQYETAKARYEQAVQGRDIAEEGTRVEEIRAAEEGVRQAEAAVRAARAGVRTAEATALQQEVRRQEVRQAEAQIGEAGAALALAQVNRDFAVLDAPFDGTVAERRVDPGTLVNPGVPLLKVQGGARRLEAVVPESLLPTIRIGAPVRLRFDAWPGKTFDGKVVEIAPQGDSGSHTFTVKAEIPAGIAVPVGMFGRARFDRGTIRRLTVPRSAIREREGLQYLFTVDQEGTARLRMVTLGTEEGETVTVLSGLNAGETVVTGGAERLRDGARVRRES
ncbi:MAG: efflux RND transporter periplasmic adaptor subunit [Capsulimonadales bacterium]|nr:efflux RND transporter periplasmic adaptor subunit [Capsulimonadales bacterium]